MMEVNLIKAQYIQAWNTKVKLPGLSKYSKNWRAEGKIGPFWGVGTIEGWVPVGGGWAQGKEEWGWIW
jgi:hypothetical protein